MNGIIILDKPQDFTSFDVVAVMRRLSRQKKIGHTGTLDPMATGVLPLLLGKATRAASLLEDSDKTYRASFRLGVATDTQDSTGKITAKKMLPVSQEQIMSVLPAFRGEILQLPPMYSAVQKDGKRLYELARQGIEVEREKRPVTIYRLELEEYDESALEGIFTVECSKGTYIRTLCADLGEALGTYGIMTGLRRTKAAGYTLKDAVTLDEARRASEEGTLESRLLPIDSVFRQHPAVNISGPQAIRFRNGGGLSLERLGAGAAKRDNGVLFRVYSPEQEFLGLGRVDTEKGELGVLRLFCGE